jgi:hypothetical protein
VNRLTERGRGVGQNFPGVRVAEQIEHSGRVRFRFLD